MALAINLLCYLTTGKTNAKSGESKAITKKKKIMTK